MKKDPKLKNYFDIAELLFNAIPLVVYKDSNGIYHGGNFSQASAFGLEHPSEFRGRTIFSILDNQESANMIDQTDREIMQHDRTLVHEQIMLTPHGSKTYLSQKKAVRDVDGKVVGLLGFAMDITEYKIEQQRSEYEKIRSISQQFEHTHQRKMAKAHAEFEQHNKQLAHQLLAPISALRMITALLDNIPEQHQETLQHITQHIEDFAHAMTNTNPAEAAPDVTLISLALRQALAKKQTTYTGMVNVQHHIDLDMHFVHTKISTAELSLLLTVLINNVLYRLKNNTAAIQIHLQLVADTVVLIVESRAKSETAELAEADSHSYAEQQQHTSDLIRLRTLIRKRKGSVTMASDTSLYSRTIVTLPRAPTPQGFITQLTLQADQTILLLDPHPYLLAAWELRFAPILTTHRHMRLVTFTHVDQLLEFLDPLSDADKKNMLLLFAQPASEQQPTWLNRIAQTQPGNTIFMTSHYDDPELINLARSFNMAIFPKLLVEHLPIHIYPSAAVTDNLGELAITDMVLIDDNQIFADSIIFRLSPKRVIHHLDPRNFLKECANYAKDIPIFIDNNFGLEVPLNGLAVARQLNEQGFTKLFLFSSPMISQNELPEQVTFIEKMDLKAMDIL